MEIEPIGKILKRVLNNALRKSVQSDEELEALIPREELDKYDCSISFEEIEGGIKLAVRRYTRKKKGGDKDDRSGGNS